MLIFKGLNSWSALFGRICETTVRNWICLESTLIVLTGLGFFPVVICCGGKVEGASYPQRRPLRMVSVLSVPAHRRPERIGAPEAGLKVNCYAFTIDTKFVCPGELAQIPQDLAPNFWAASIFGNFHGPPPPV